MLIYFLIILIITFLAYKESKGESLSKNGLIIIMTILTLIVGLGDMLGGYDRYIYSQLFEQVADQVMVNDLNINKMSIFNLYKSDFGYCWLNVFLAYITRNRYIFILLLTIIIYVNILYAIKNYTNNYALALLVFMGFWFFFTFTYLRQVLAVSFAWYSIKYIQQRNLKKFLMVMFVAFSLHNSAIVFFPLYFIPIRQYKITTILVVAICCILLGVTGIPSLLYDAYDNATNNVRQTVLYTDGDNIRWIYLLEAVVLLYLIFKNYRELFKTPQQTLMTNISILFCLVLVILYKSTNGGRISWFFMIGIISTLSNIAASRSNYHTINKSFIIILCVCLYLRILFAWGILLSPYKTFLTSGAREGDYIYEEYEYNHDYEENKFCR